MKTKVTIFIFLTLMMVLFSIDYNPTIREDTPDAYAVIRYMTDDLNSHPNDVNDYYLLFDSYKLDSKNFVNVMSYFNNGSYEIKEVYPYLNPMYQNMLSSVYAISYDSKTLTDGIAKIYKSYMNKLEEYGLSDEIDKALVNGIKIRMIKIRINNQMLYSFLHQYKNVKYSLTNDGLFRSF